MDPTIKFEKMTDQKLELLAPYAFRGLKFKLGENLLTIRELCGNVAKASDGKIEIVMERRGNAWFFNGELTKL